MDNLVNPEFIQEWIIDKAPMVIGAIITLIIGFWLAGKISRLFTSNLKRRGTDETIIPFLSSLISVGLKIMILIAIAGMFGIQTASFVAVLGALTFAIGMALQGSLGHFASGVLLIIFKPYRVGDLVEIGGGNTGTVEGIQVFNTILRTLDNKKIIIPNSLVTNNVITNISGQEEIGVELTFGIGYDDDIDRAREIILKVGKECPHILDQPRQAVVVSALADSSVNLSTRPFVKSENYWDSYFYMMENVKKAFDKEDIGIPYQTIDINMHKK